MVVPAESSRRRLIGAVTVVGGASVIAGALLPWLTVFSGLQTFAGINGTNGRVLASGGVGAMLVGICYAIGGDARLRYAIGAAGFALAVFSAYLVAQLLDVYQSLEGFFVPTLGPGVFVAAGGALLIVLTTLLDASSQPGYARQAPLGTSTATPIALSASAGMIHLMVAGPHMAESALVGAFFVVVGLAQLGWAVLVVLWGPSRGLLVAATGNIIVVSIWVVSRTTGLPILAAPGGPEPVGPVDALASAFEVAVVGWLVWCVARQRTRRRAALF